MAIEEHAEFVYAVGDLVFLEDMDLALRLPLIAGHFLKRQDGIIGRTIGIMGTSAR